MVRSWVQAFSAIQLTGRAALLAAPLVIQPVAFVQTQQIAQLAEIRQPEAKAGSLPYSRSVFSQQEVRTSLAAYSGALADSDRVVSDVRQAAAVSSVPDALKPAPRTLDSGGHAGFSAAAKPLPLKNSARAPAYVSSRDASAGLPAPATGKAASPAAAAASADSGSPTQAATAAAGSTAGSSGSGSPLLQGGQQALGNAAGAQTSAGAGSAQSSASAATASTAQQANGLTAGTLNLTTARNSPISISVARDILANASDVTSGATITFVQADSGGSGATPGSITSQDSGATLLYTPASDFSGSDMFFYIITDSAHRATGRVNVTIADLGVPVIEQSSSGTSTSSNVVSTSGVFESDSEDLYLAFVATQGAGISATSVTGLGGAWTLLTSQCSAGNSELLSVWWQIGGTGGEGSITANLSGNAASASIIAIRAGGVNTANWPATFAGANNAGATSSCAASAPTSNLSVALNNLNVGNVVLNVIAYSGSTATLSGATGSSVLSAVAGSGATGVSLGIRSTPVATQGTVTSTATGSATLYWSSVSIVLPGT